MYSLYAFSIFSYFISDILKLLDRTKYSRFNPDPEAKDVNEFNPVTDLNQLRLLIDYKYCLTFKDYKEVSGTYEKNRNLNGFIDFDFIFVVQRGRRN